MVALIVAALRVASPKARTPFPLPAEVLVQNRMGLYTITPRSPRARKWIEDHVQREDWHRLGASLILDDGHYFWPIVRGMKAAGLRVAAGGPRG